MRKLVIAIGLGVAAGLAGVALAQEPNPAAPAAAPVNPCANLAEAQCGGVTGCVWLPGYKVADGAEVPGYCRPAPKSISARRRPVAEQPR